MSVLATLDHSFIVNSMRQDQWNIADAKTDTDSDGDGPESSYDREIYSQIVCRWYGALILGKADLWYSVVVEEYRQRTQIFEAILSNTDTDSDGDGPQSSYDL